MPGVLEKLTTLETLPVSSVILDSTGTIVGVNAAWKSFGRQNGLCLPNYGIGVNYLRYCEAAGGGLAREMRDLLARRRDLVMQVYPCDSPGESRWFMLLAFPLSLSGGGGIAILHADLSSVVPLPLIEKGKRPAAKNSAAPGMLLAAIAGSVEASVSKTLTSQLEGMLAQPRAREKKKPPSKEKAGEVFHRARLSKRQMEVFRLLAEGKTNAEIAKALFRSPHTIKLHVSAILRELNLKSRTQAALLASKLPKDK